MQRPATRFRVAAAAIAALFLHGAAPGVVVDRLGGGNTSAPADDRGWANVGAIGNATGVYVGGGWVLTANHVGSGNFTLAGTTYTVVAGTGRRLTNNGVAGKSVLTDLYLFQVAGRPAVPSLSIPAASAAVGESVTMIGRGRSQSTTLTQWTVNTSVTPWTWSVSPPATSPNAAGFTTTSAARVKSWGTNTVDGAGWFNAGSDVFGVATTFDDATSPDEGQVVAGDSGGGVFVQRGGKWALTGIIIAAGLFPNQPSNTAVYGNASYMADLSFYREQIGAIVVPEPPGGTSMALAAACAGAPLLPRLRRRAAAAIARRT